MLFYFSLLGRSPIYYGTMAINSLITYQSDRRVFQRYWAWVEVHYDHQL